VTGSATHEITITNEGTATLESFGRSTTGVQFGAADGCLGGTLAGGASCTVTITFHPSSLGPHAGAFRWDYNNGSAFQSIGINLSGTGRQQLAISESSFDFGAVAVTGSATHEITITNEGTATLESFGRSTTGVQFGAADGCLGGTLAGGASCTVTITFHPSSLGPHAGAFRWDYNNGSAFQSIGINLSGSGIADTLPPVLTTPGDLTVEATGPGGAARGFTVTAADAVSGNRTVTCTPPSGSTFVLGTTTVGCDASDAAGNPAHASFNVTVVDTTPPTISGVPANRIVEATSAAGATVTYTPPTATDLVDGAVTVTCSPASGATFGLGTRTVECSATDSRLNKRTATFEVTVRDTTRPTLTLPTGITIPATSPGGAAVTYSATASDAVSGAVTARCSPASGSTFAPGNTTVSCSATDAALNTATGSFTVHVSGALEIAGALQSGSVGTGPGKSLENKAADAKAAAAAGNTALACSTLQSYASELAAQTGKKVTVAKAAELARLVAQARGALGCL
jgi:hypothetical protein